ncbi:MAG: hypothetical protein JRF61_06300 [Deltaproteobacteria bacterium]|jgi:hypothetical protein|nr:hypothetical protein [Deltaproteobacteria bacterium]
MSHDPDDPTRADREPELTRRDLLRNGTLLVAGLSLSSWVAVDRARAETSPTAAPLPDATRHLLETSGLVYVSPLRRNGGESRCHGEVWFGWIDDSVVLITSREAWKARALARDLDRARIWVGDHGRWKGLITRNERFREAPHFEARAARSKDPALLEQLMRLYTRKYPEEFGSWEKRMRTGFASGERVLIRYAPI